MTDGERIRAWRTALGMSARELAAKADVARNTLQMAESGQPVRASSIARILSALAQLGEEAGVPDPSGATGSTIDLQVLIFNTLADYTSDLEWLDEVAGKLETALREAGLLGEGAS